MAVKREITICFEVYVVGAGQMIAKVVRSWPRLLLTGTRANRAVKYRAALVFTVDCSLVSRQIVGCAESRGSLVAIFVGALVRFVMPMAMLPTTVLATRQVHT